MTHEPETPAERLSRVRKLSERSKTFFLSDYDQAALRHVLAQRDALQQEVERLKLQARAISECLSDAGIGPCTIPEGVLALLHRTDQAEAQRDALAAALRDITEDYILLCGDGMTADTEPPQLTAARAALHALVAAPEGRNDTRA